MTSDDRFYHDSWLADRRMGSLSSDQTVQWVTAQRGAAKPQAPSTPHPAQEHRRWREFAESLADGLDQRQ